MLTDQEETQIRAEAERLYPLDDPRKNMHHDNQGQRGKQEAYIAAATLYQERIKGLLEALEKITRINSALTLNGLISKLKNVANDAITNYNESLKG